MEVAQIDPAVEYKELTVRLWGKGVIERGSVSGALLGGSRRFVARASNIVLSRIDARHGAIGIVPDKLDGALLSNDFPTFAVDDTRLSVAFFSWLSRTSTFVALCRAASEGTTNRVRLKEERLLDSVIHLPPLAEQRRVVARLNGCESRLDELRRLRTQVRSQLDAIGIVDALLDEVRSERALEDLLLEPPRNGLSPRPATEGGGTDMLRIDAVSSTVTRFVNTDLAKEVQVAETEADRFQVRDGDIFLVRYNGDLHRVAKAAIARRLPSQPVVYPDKLIRLRADHAKILADYLTIALASRFVRRQVEDVGRTTAGNIGINGRQIRQLRVPVPSLSEQAIVVRRFDALHAKFRLATELSSEVMEAHEALRSSILARAFTGAL